jgi:predicted AAA+ superfamily ATPase
VALFSLQHLTTCGQHARTCCEEKICLYDFSSIPDRGARFENLVALHLLKLRHLWNDFGCGDFTLRYVRDREKREVDFLISERNKPFALFEAKLTPAGLTLRSGIPQGD